MRVFITFISVLFAYCSATSQLEFLFDQAYCQDVAKAGTHPGLEASNCESFAKASASTKTCLLPNKCTEQIGCELIATLSGYKLCDRQDSYPIFALAVELDLTERKADLIESVRAVAQSNVADAECLFDINPTIDGLLFSSLVTSDVVHSFKPGTIDKAKSRLTKYLKSNVRKVMTGGEMQLLAKDFALRRNPEVLDFVLSVLRTDAVASSVGYDLIVSYQCSSLLSLLAQDELALDAATYTKLATLLTSSFPGPEHTVHVHENLALLFASGVDARNGFQCGSHCLALLGNFVESRLHNSDKTPAVLYALKISLRQYLRSPSKSVDWNQVLRAGSVVLNAERAFPLPLLNALLDHTSVETSILLEFYTAIIDRGLVKCPQALARLATAVVTWMDHLIAARDTPPAKLSTLLYTINNLYTHGVTLPADVLSKVAPLLDPQRNVPATVRAALSFAVALSVTYPVDDFSPYRALLNAALAPLMIADESFSAMTEPVLLVAQQRGVTALFATENEFYSAAMAVDRLSRKQNAVFSALQGFFDLSSLGEQESVVVDGKNTPTRFERVLNQLFKDADWPLDAVLKLVNSALHGRSTPNDVLTSQRAVFTALHDVLDAIVNYDIPYYLVARCGRTLPELLADTAAPADWNRVVWTAKADNSLAAPVLSSVLLKQIMVTDLECLKSFGNGAECDILVSIPPEQVAHMNRIQAAKDEILLRFAPVAVCAKGVSDLPAHFASLTGHSASILFAVYESRLFVSFGGAKPTQIVSSRAADSCPGCVRAPHHLYHLLYDAADDCRVPVAEIVMSTSDLASLYASLRAAGFSGVTGTQMRTWEAADFESWRLTSPCPDLHDEGQLALCLAAAVSALERTVHLPRDIQIYAAVKMLEGADRGGVLAQMGTGEGKSTVVALFSTVMALSSKNPDIIVPNFDLAARDVDAYRAFYALLGLVVAHNSEQAVEGGTFKKCYDANVLFGDITTSDGDALHDLSSNVRGTRRHEVVVLDEVDSSLIDQTSYSVQRGGEMPGFFDLTKVLVHTHMYHKTAVFPALYQENDKVFLWQDVEGHEGFAHKIGPIEGFRELLYNLTLDEMRATISGNLSSARNGDVLIPRFLFDYASEQAGRRSESSIKAWEQILNVTYAVVNSNYYIPSAPPHLVIAPVDSLTQVINHRMTLSAAVSQFMQLREELALTSETLTSVFYSLVGYISKYRGNIFGLSGTLGDNVQKSFMHKQYNVTFVQIPSFIAKRSYLFKDQLTLNDPAQWYQNIKHSILREKRRGKAVLVLAESIKGMYYLHHQLSLDGIVCDRYGGDFNTSAVDRVLQSGDCIVATAKATRGTDIIFVRGVELNGGLHVAITFLPETGRARIQTEGRQGRNGQPGSVEFILNMKRLPDGVTSHLDSSTAMEKMSAELSVREGQTLHENRACRIPYIRMQDDLFYDYVDVTRVFDSASGREIITSSTGLPGCNVSAMTLNQVCVYVAREGGTDILYLHAAPLSQSAHKSIRASTELEMLDSAVLRKIISTLAMENAKLSNHDMEHIHFVLLVHGYSAGGKHRHIMERISMLYSMDVGKSAQAEPLSGRHAADSINAVQDSVVNFDVETFTLKELGLLERLLRETQGAFSRDDMVAYTESLRTVKYRRLFALWMEDRDVYHKRFEVSQLQQDFAMFRERQEDLIFNTTDCLQILYDPKRIANGTVAEALAERESRVKDQLHKAFLSEFRNRVVSLDGEVRGDVLLGGRANHGYIVGRALSMQAVELHQLDKFRHGGALGWLWAASVPIVRSCLVDAPMTFAHNELTRVIAEDEAYSWIPRAARAYLQLWTKSGEITKEEQLGDAQRAINDFIAEMNAVYDTLHNKELPQVEWQWASLMLLNSSTIHSSELSKQLIIQMGFLQNYEKRVLANLDSARQAFNERKMLRPGKTWNISDLTMDLDAEQIVSNLVTNTSFVQLNLGANSTDVTLYTHVVNSYVGKGAFVYDVESFSLKKKKKGWLEKWAGTLCSIVMGVLQVCIGAIMQLSGVPFLSTFGANLIRSGITDIIRGFESIIRNKPIDLDLYIKSLGMQLAMNLLLSGLTHFSHAIGLIKVEAPGSLFATLKYEMKVALGMYAVGALVDKVSDYLLKSHADQILKSIRASVAVTLDKQKDNLRRIFLADAMSNDHYSELLLVRAHEASERYSEKFMWSSVAAALIPAAARATGVGGIVNGAATVMSVAEGLQKLHSLNEDFDTSLQKIITEVANGIPGEWQPAQWVETNLAGELGKDVAAGVMKVAGAHNFNLEKQPCDEILGWADAGEFSSYMGALNGYCEYYQELRSDEYAQSKRGELAESLSQVSYGNFRGIISENIVSPVRTWADGYLRKKMGGLFSDSLNDMDELGADAEAKEQERLDKLREGVIPDATKASPTFTMGPAGGAGAGDDFHTGFAEGAGAEGESGAGARPDTSQYFKRAAKSVVEDALKAHLGHVLQHEKRPLSLKDFGRAALNSQLALFNSFADDFKHEHPDLLEHYAKLKNVLNLDEPEVRALLAAGRVLWRSKLEGEVRGSKLYKTYEKVKAAENDVARWCARNGPSLQAEEALRELRALEFSENALAAYSRTLKDKGKFHADGLRNMTYELFGVTYPVQIVRKSDMNVPQEPVPRFKHF